MAADLSLVPSALIKGYHRFRADHFDRHQAIWRNLAKGQSPETMIISCSDSRVDPTVVFDAAPGDLFVVRNVANLVPPYERHGVHHGTSAALEFAVGSLKVSHVVVMGHAQCGGIAAYLEGLHGGEPREGFIAQWISIVNGARSYLPADAPTSGAELQTAMERASILNSIDNLLSFPFVRRAVTAGDLRLHGMRFGIADGELEVLDPATGEATPVSTA